MLLKIGLFFTGVFISFHFLFAQSNKFTVGGKEIAIPTLNGFEAPAEKNTIFENAFNRSPNHLIVNYIVNSYPGVMAYAAITKAVENHDMSKDDFDSYKQIIAKSYDQLLKAAQPKANQTLSDASKEMSKDMQTQVQIKANDMQNLGVFNQTDNSICTTQAQTAQVNVGGVDVKNSKQVVSLCSMVVGGRLINLYVVVPYKSEVELKWSQNAVLKWREIVMAANENKTFAEHVLPSLDSAVK